jgi:hypothetical protein
MSPKVKDPVLPPPELWSVMVKTSTGWQFGPPMYGLDLVTTIAGDRFMCHSNAVDLAVSVAAWQKPGTVKLVRYVLDPVSEEIILPKPKPKKRSVKR